jgi:hypothetical protein
VRLLWRQHRSGRVRFHVEGAIPSAAPSLAPTAGTTTHGLCHGTEIRPSADFPGLAVVPTVAGRLRLRIISMRWPVDLLRHPPITENCHSRELSQFHRLLLRFFPQFARLSLIRMVPVVHVYIRQRRDARERGAKRVGLHGPCDVRDRLLRRMQKTDTLTAVHGERGAACPDEPPTEADQPQTRCTASRLTPIQPVGSPARARSPDVQKRATSCMITVSSRRF